MHPVPGTNIITEGVPDVPDDLKDLAFRYFAGRSASFGAWAPSGGGVLVHTRFGDTAQVHHVATPMGARTQLTFFPEPVHGAYVPNSGAHPVFLFLKDTGGNEYYQVYSYDMQSGAVTVLTDGTSRHGSVVWSNAGDRFAYFQAERDSPNWRVFVCEPFAEGRPRRCVVEAEGCFSPMDWSADDQRILIRKSISAAQSQLLVLELATGELTPLKAEAADGSPVAYGAAMWQRNAAGPSQLHDIFYASDEGLECKSLRRVRADGTGDALLADLGWDITTLQVAPAGDLLAFVINEDGFGALFFMRPSDGAMARVGHLPKGLVHGIEFSPDGMALAITLNTPVTPGDVFSLQLPTDRSVLFAAGIALDERILPLTRWTASEVGGLPSSSFVEPELVHYPTFDTLTPEECALLKLRQALAGSASPLAGPASADALPQRRIPAFVYWPSAVGVDGAADVRLPVVIHIHGGPESQSRPSFVRTYQFLLRELGMVVIDPNVRGSSGYGKTYRELDTGKLREDAVRDIGALLDWIEHHPRLDPARVVVWGGSYGGYMVLASLIHFGHRLRAGAEVVGISNFVTFLENTSGYRRDLRRKKYGDERDPEMRAFLHSISPTTHADRIQCPLLIAQGANDPRVPASESAQMRDAVKANGAEVWYLLAENEGHGFAKKANVDFLQCALFMFLQKHVLSSSRT